MDLDRLAEEIRKRDAQHAVVDTLVSQYRNDPSHDPRALEAHQYRGANQRPSELTFLIRILEQQRPERVLEIGCESGGTLWLWCQLATDQAQLMGIDSDTQPGPFQSLLGRGDGYPARAQQQIRLLNRSSRDPEALAEVEAWFDGPVDFLFIDGDHATEGVTSDWETFSPLIAPGGIVAFHDIDGGNSNGVERFWNEQLVPNHRTDQYIDPLDRTMGVGVVYLP